MKTGESNVGRGQYRPQLSCCPLLEVQGAAEVRHGEAAQRAPVGAEQALRDSSPLPKLSRTTLKGCRGQVPAGLEPQGPASNRRLPASPPQGALALTHKLCLIPEFQSLENKPLSHCLAPAFLLGNGGRERRLHGKGGGWARSSHGSSQWREGTKEQGTSL